MKKNSAVLKHLPKILSIFLIGAGLLLHSEKAADGVREGLSLLGNVVIPSLFPFLVLSSYITETPSAEVFCRLVKKPVENIGLFPGGLVGIVYYPCGNRAHFRVEVYCNCDGAYLL